MSHQHASLPLRKQVNRILKVAEEQASDAKKKCDECGGKLVDGKCVGCKPSNEKESMGSGAMGSYTSGDMSGMDGGMKMSSANLVHQLEKLGSALDYASENIYELVDDRPVAEKLAELAAFQATVSKIAAGELGPGESSMGEGNQLKNTLPNDKHQKQEQVTPHRGKKMVPNETPVSSMGELGNNMSDDRTSEEWMSDPLKGKKASVALRAILAKRANAPGAMPSPGAGAPPAGGAAGAAGGAPAPAPAPAPAAPAVPPPPPGPDARQIAMQLQAQGNLTPEALAGAAGIAVEEAAAIIASMTGGTGAPQMPPATAPAAQGMPPEAAGAPAPQPGGGGPGMSVQASADPAALFQSALRKIAGEDVSPANISAKKSDSRPENEGISTPSNPGRQGLASNEAAINFTAQAGRQPRDEAVSAVLTAKVPYKAESGKMTGGPGKADEMLGDKTSAAKAIVARLNNKAKRPL